MPSAFRYDRKTAFKPVFHNFHFNHTVPKRTGEHAQYEKRLIHLLFIVVTFWLSNIKPSQPFYNVTFNSLNVLSNSELANLPDRVCSLWCFTRDVKLRKLNSPPNLRFRYGLWFQVNHSNSHALICILLAGDISVNPGPTCTSTLLKCTSTNCSCTCSNDDGSEYTDPYPHFDIGLPATGLRIGHWNVNHLTSTKFDQIKLYLSKKDGKAQVDVMFLTETFLKSDVSDSLYDVEGFTLLIERTELRNMAVGFWRTLVLN